VRIAEIIEWEHVDGIEAQIIGAGRDAFALNFFGTDYMENREVYKKGGTLNISLTGFVYVIQEMKELPANWSSDFTSYMPNQQFSCGYEYDFVADVISVKPVSLEDDDGYLLDLKLITNPDKNFFNLEAFVNRENMRMGDLKVGQKVAGCFWLQGRLL